MAQVARTEVRTEIVRSTLFTFFEDLHFQRVFQYNPAEGVIVEYKPPEMKTLSAEQVHHFLESAQDHPMEAFYYLAIATGMREGELLGLRWSDIDWASQSIKVQRQVQWVLKAKKGPGPRYFFKAPKSKASIRRVALGTATIRNYAFSKRSHDAWIGWRQMGRVRSGFSKPLWTAY